jgi:hypothetical protein
MCETLDSIHSTEKKEKEEEIHIFGYYKYQLTV